jgi:uncharacterized protein
MSQVPGNFSKLFPRRRFLKVLASGVLGGGGLLGWAIFVEPHWLSISYHRLIVPNLPANWMGKRLVHISDLHIGKTKLAFLQSAMRSVNPLKPDVLVITGDFINHQTPGSDKDIHDVLSCLQPASMATLACLGNHDYGRGWAQLKLADRVAEGVQARGIQVLRDEQVAIEGVDFYGLDDYWTPKFEAKACLRAAKSDRAAICLCHNPDVCDEPVWGDFRGVILSGHTHGGQCKPPFLPAPITPVRNKRFQQGFYDVANRNQLFINRGLGHTSPVRFNCRPEITVFELASEVA